MHANLAKDENVRNSLAQYSLEHCYVDMLVHDASCCIWKGEELFDAIVTDRELYMESWLCIRHINVYSSLWD